MLFVFLPTKLPKTNKETKNYLQSSTSFERKLDFRHGVPVACHLASAEIVN